MSKLNTKPHKRTIYAIPSRAELESVDSDSSKEVSKKRVAAYARVSTDQEKQEGSFFSQIGFYTDYINSKPEWKFVKVYADKGISGTSYKHRDALLQMIEDAKAGEIDLILTKSVSRLARNTVDSLNITRELKSYGVEVFFEKEQLSSFDSNAELLFTIASSVAQEESRSLSENVRWGKQRSMEAGNVPFTYKHFLGYRRGEDGNPEIVEEEAEVIRKIYSLYLDGKSLRAIGDQLSSENIKTPSGLDEWSATTVRSILTNEKYKGDARLGKTYVVDFLTKKVKVNHGERKQYYVHDSHPAIIDKETFDAVQDEIERRKKK